MDRLHWCRMGPDYGSEGCVSKLTPRACYLTVVGADERVTLIGLCDYQVACAEQISLRMLSRALAAELGR
jgi:hypothetical protein